jgi:hypothetical protein
MGACKSIAKPKNHNFETKENTNATECGNVNDRYNITKNKHIWYKEIRTTNIPKYETKRRIKIRPKSF